MQQIHKDPKNHKGLPTVFDFYTEVRSVRVAAPCRLQREFTPTCLVQVLVRRRPPPHPCLAAAVVVNNHGMILLMRLR